MKRIFFIYDELMLQQVQDLVKVDMEFIGFALAKANMYFWSDRKKKRRYFIRPKDTINSIFGGLYVINDDLVMHKLCAFYNSSVCYLGKVIPEDIYKPQNIKVKPIKIKSIDPFEFESYNEYIDAESFIGNELNFRVQRSIKHNYYKLKSFDKESFKILLKERLKR